MIGLMCGHVQGPFSPLSGLSGKIGIGELCRLEVLHYENSEDA